MSYLGEGKPSTDFFRCNMTYDVTQHLVIQLNHDDPAIP